MVDIGKVFGETATCQRDILACGALGTMPMDVAVARAVLVYVGCVGPRQDSPAARGVLMLGDVDP